MNTVRRLLPLLALVAIGLFLRGFRLSFPPGYYFDEQYHVPAAKLASILDERQFEYWHGSLQEDPDCIFSDAENSCVNNYDWLHPPLAKYVQGLSMRVLGVTEISWRLPSLFFGLGVIVATYSLSMALFQNRPIAFLASFFVTTDGLLVGLSRIAMNDIQLVFWLLVAVWSYWLSRKKNKKYLFLCGFFLGLALATKWSAGFFVFGLMIFDVFTMRFTSITARISHFNWTLFSLLILPTTVYFLSYFPLFIQGKDLSYFIEYHSTIIDYQLHAPLQHPYASTPLQWVLNSKPLLLWRNQTAEIVLFGNPVFHLFGVVALVLLTNSLLQQKRQQKVDTFVLQIFLLLMCFFISWVPWFFSPRILFYYHYAPSVPFLAILFGYWLYILREKTWYIGGITIAGKSLFNGILVATVCMMLATYPFMIGLHV